MKLPFPDGDALAPLYRHLEACYPNEGCGVILQGTDGFRVAALENVYDRYHALDPDQFPRTARTAYLIEPAAWLNLSLEAERAGERIAFIVHSHCDVGAYFSHHDTEVAAPGGTPLHPGVAYLVVAVNTGVVDKARAFFWLNGGFVEAGLEPMSRQAG